MDQYYLRARYYDQGVGRFTSMDTYQGRMGEPVTLHKYAYGNLDPTNTIDPSGNVGLSDIGASLKLNGILTTSSNVAGRAAFQRLLVGTGKEAGKKAFGMVGEEIIALAKQSLLEILLQEAAGKTFKGAGAKGTAAHREFERLIKGINEKYKKFGFRITAEVFRNKNSGRKVKKRAKDSIGIDVAILSTKTGKTLLAFDLKTGRGSSKKRNSRLSKVFDGANVIEILVSKKRK